MSKKNSKQEKLSKIAKEVLDIFKGDITDAEKRQKDAAAIQRMVENRKVDEETKGALEMSRIGVKAQRKR